MVSRNIAFVLLFGMILLMMTPHGTVSAVATPTTHTGVMVPLYTYPGSTWTTVLQAKEANPGVPVVAIINPNSGPGSSPDPNYADGIRQLQSAGIIVLGYDHTSFGLRPIGDVEADLNSYVSWYKVNGIFFDEMPTASGFESYYSALNAYAKASGLTFTVGNPGLPIPNSYMGTVDSIVMYEDIGLPSVSVLSGIYSSDGANDFVIMGHTTGPPSQSYMTAISSYANYVYFTDGAGGNPYGTLSSYFASEVAMLDSSTTVNVSSMGPNGTPIVGMYTTVDSGGISVASGYTPLSFTATFADAYTVCISNYADYQFNHWADGSTSQCHEISQVQNPDQTAYFVSAPSQSTSGTSGTTGTASAHFPPGTRTLGTETPNVCAPKSASCPSVVNDWNSTVTAVVYLSITDPVGETVSVTTTTMTLAPGQYGVVSWPDLNMNGAFSATYFAVSTSGIPLSQSTSFSFTA